jgi:hypothetical protein
MIRKLLVVLIIIRVMFILLIMIHMLCLPLALLLCMVEVGLGEIKFIVNNLVGPNKSWCRRFGPARTLNRPVNLMLRVPAQMG